MMTPKQLREENSELRDIIVRGVMSTSDQLRVAEDAKTRAQAVAQQARVSLNIANANRGYLDEALMVLVTLHNEGEEIPDSAWAAAKTALEINAYWRDHGRDATL